MAKQSRGKRDCRTSSSPVHNDQVTEKCVANYRDVNKGFIFWENYGKLLLVGV